MAATMSDGAVKRGYKQTEVGVIPEDWDIRALKELIAIKSGFAFSSDHFSDMGPILLTPGNFKLDGGLYFNERNTKRYAGTYSSSLLFHRGDLLVVMTDLTPECDLLGKPAFVNVDEPILHNQRIGKIVPINDRLTPRFLYWHFLSDGYSARMKATATGSTVRHTSNASIYDSFVSLPSTAAEQEAIAEALSDADALIESLEQLLAKKRHLKQGAMQELLTGQKRLPGFSSAWQSSSLLSFAGGSKVLFDDGDWIEAKFLTEQGVRLVQTGNIGVGSFVEKAERKFISEASAQILRCKDIYAGDILICRLAEPAGRACILPDLGPDRVITAVDVTIFRPLPELANRNYLVQVFSTNSWLQFVNERCGGSTRNRIARSVLGNIPISLPSIDEQTAIAAVLSDMDAELAAVAARLAKARQVKAGMMQELLTGRIRLV
ncbi:MAG TPA: restriction endonuclease subunit S [Polyangia bacterium]|jgi:type I restriction enzyme S subunit|nr:restriction endonuclease subunit S [Polyangia bacterium]